MRDARGAHARDLSHGIIPTRAYAHAPNLDRAPRAYARVPVRLCGMDGPHIRARVRVRVEGQGGVSTPHGGTRNLLKSLGPWGPGPHDHMSNLLKSLASQVGTSPALSRVKSERGKQAGRDGPGDWKGGI